MRKLCLALSFAIVALQCCLQLAGEERKAAERSRPNKYAKATSLSEALTILAEEVKTDGHPEYVPLLKEAEISRAIVSALDSYERQYLDDKNDADRARFRDILKPAYLGIAKDWLWRPDCEFSKFYQLGTADGQTIVCFCVRIQLALEEPKGGGFALPVVDLYYGRFSPKPQKVAAKD
jgi:hypothetical protein